MSLQLRANKDRLVLNKLETSEIQIVSSLSVRIRRAAFAFETFLMNNYKDGCKVEC